MANLKKPDRSRPNILFIMADQHRFDYLGCAGANWVRTPNLDALAARGVRFSHCCTNSPICAASRIALATGLYPTRTGAMDNQGFLPIGRKTYYQRLRDYGYRVACVGKLDLAKPEGYNGRYGDRPIAYSWGFTHPEECEGKGHAGQSTTPIGPYTNFLMERGLLEAFHKDYRSRGSASNLTQAPHDSVLPADAFEDVYIGRRAAEWIDKIPDDFPWHMFVSFVGPHDPFDPPTEYADRYRNAKMPPAIIDPLEGKPHCVQKRSRQYDPELVAITRRQYCAAIECIDDQIGEILKSLERRGLTERTHIIFASDHGEMLGDHGMYTKHIAYESSLRVPLLVCGPGIEGGRVTDTLVELIDVNATICDMAGLPALADVDARSFSDVLHGRRETHRGDIVSEERIYRSIRTDRYKYIWNYNDRDELYDLRDDPHELRNLVDHRPDLVRELSKRMAQRFKEGGCFR